MLIWLSGIYYYWGWTNDTGNIVYFKKDRRLEEIVHLLKQIQNEHPHALTIIDIDREPILESEFGSKAPVLDIGVYRLVKTFGIDEITLAFEKAEARLDEARSKGNLVLVKRISQPLQMEKSDRFSYWFSKISCWFWISLCFCMSSLLYLRQG